MLANLENAAVATGLEKVSFHSNPKKGQCRRIPVQLCSFHVLARLCPDSFKLSFSSTWTENRCTSWVSKRQRNQRSNCHHLLDRGVSKRIPEKHLLLLHRLYSKAFDCVDCNKLWKIFKEMGKPDHLTCLLRNLYAGQEPTVRNGHETTDGFLPLLYHQGSPKICLCYLFYM